jgi:hypothetical protein
MFHEYPRDRHGIRDHLSTTGLRFVTLFEGLTNEDLRHPSGNPAWTIRAVLTHLVWSLELLPREVAAAGKGKGMYNFPTFLRDPLNAWATRVNARRQTLESLRRRYDAACDYTSDAGCVAGRARNARSWRTRGWSCGPSCVPVFRTLRKVRVSCRPTPVGPRTIRSSRRLRPPRSDQRRCG